MLYERNACWVRQVLHLPEFWYFRRKFGYFGISANFPFHRLEEILKSAYSIALSAYGVIQDAVLEQIYFGLLHLLVAKISQECLKATSVPKTCHKGGFFSLQQSTYEN